MMRSEVVMRVCLACAVCDEWSIELKSCSHLSDRLCIRTYTRLYACKSILLSLPPSPCGVLSLNLLAYLLIRTHTRTHTYI